MTQVAEWLQKYWVLLAAAGSATVAVGAGYQKIETMEQAIKSQAQTIQKVEDMRATQSALDERTKLLLEQSRRQEELLQELLMQTR